MELGSSVVEGAVYNLHNFSSFMYYFGLSTRTAVAGCKSGSKTGCKSVVQCRVQAVNIITAQWLGAQLLLHTEAGHAQTSADRVQCAVRVQIVA